MADANTVSLPNPLLPLHQKTELLETVPYESLEIVSTFGEPEAEYAAIRKSAGLMDLPQRGILELTGKDRLNFLNNLLTNETWDKGKKTGMTAGSAIYGFFLNNKGRIVCDMNVLELGHHTWLEMDARFVASTKAAFDKYLFAEQVKMTDRLQTLHEIALHGPKAAEILAVTLEPMKCASVKILEKDAVVWRDDVSGVPGYFMILSNEDAAEVWTKLVEQFGELVSHGKRPLRRIGWAAFNATRVEAGRPMFGIDFTTDYALPAETGQLDRAVSFTKGCYLGQEIVARMHARNQVARKLCCIRMEDDALPIAGSRIYDDASNEIGAITSSSISPVRSNIALCIGYLKKPHFASGTLVNIPAEGKMRKGTVVEGFGIQI